MIPNVLIIVAASLVVTTFTSFLDWLLVYRTEQYQTLTDEIKDLEKKLDNLKKNRDSSLATASTKGNSKDKKDKQIEVYKKRIQDTNQKLTMHRMKSMIATGVVMISAFGFLSSAFDGRIVAKLPFHPFSLLQGMTHRNLPGTDETDCGFLFIYVLASMSIRASIQKYLGWSQSQPSMFQMPEEYNEK